MPVPPDAPDVDAMADAGIDARPVDAAMTAGLILHWSFDEAAGAQVRDSSLTGFHGTAVGTSGGPTPRPRFPC